LDEERYKNAVLPGKQKAGRRESRVGDVALVARVFPVLSYAMLAMADSDTGGR
jgi:hypothetical protein